MLRNVRQLILIAGSSALTIQAQQPIKQADRIDVTKSDHTMMHFARGKILKTYHVSLGSNSSGMAKQKQGDHETPEGLYTIDSRNGHSCCHLSLHISYPNVEDRQRARKLNVDPGGNIMIHGLPPGNDWVAPGQHLSDWTYGCIGVTNPEIEEIWKLVPTGTPIEIRH